MARTITGATKIRVLVVPPTIAVTSCQSYFSRSMIKSRSQVESIIQRRLTSRLLWHETCAALFEVHTFYITLSQSSNLALCSFVPLSAHALSCLLCDYARAIIYKYLLLINGECFRLRRAKNVNRPRRAFFFCPWTGVLVRALSHGANKIRLKLACNHIRAHVSVLLIAKRTWNQSSRFIQIMTISRERSFTNNSSRLEKFRPGRDEHVQLNRLNRRVSSRSLIADSSLVSGEILSINVMRYN